MAISIEKKLVNLEDLMVAFKDFSMTPDEWDEYINPGPGPGPGPGPEPETGGTLIWDEEFYDGWSEHAQGGLVGHIGSFRNFFYGETDPSDVFDFDVKQVTKMEVGADYRVELFDSNENLVATIPRGTLREVVNDGWNYVWRLGDTTDDRWLDFKWVSGMDWDLYIGANYVFDVRSTVDTDVNIVYGKVYLMDE